MRAQRPLLPGVRIESEPVGLHHTAGPRPELPPHVAASPGSKIPSRHPTSTTRKGHAFDEGTPVSVRDHRDEQLAQGWITADGTPADGFKTPAQGAATAVWAATSPLLDGHGGAYCQDCDVAEPTTTDDMLIGGVKPWPVDPAAAARLWELSSELTNLDAFS
ncbi:oxidoreductase [Streptomyces bingchenggensis BCW-1]|uniref:Oxidoreductase n=1 Tax=Streptomyces bingchenggensis (strain BCW-1) TaxID=749414 RepID=D7BRJ8_STRBB|nr:MULTISPECIES: oxidoreductase [Streptomyces]ADI05161.1 oxidoreductase [Streptomyces bingchenggensis BCW-1]